MLSSKPHKIFPVLNQISENETCTFMGKFEIQSRWQIWKLTFQALKFKANPLIKIKRNMIQANVNNDFSAAAASSTLESKTQLTWDYCFYYRATLLLHPTQPWWWIWHYGVCRISKSWQMAKNHDKNKINYTNFALKKVANNNLVEKKINK